MTVVSSIVLAYLLDRNFPIMEVVPFPINQVGWIMLAAGIFFALRIISLIRARNVTSNVTDVPPALITKGVYSFSRNPFYLSYVVIVLGAACIFGSLGAFAAPVICFMVLHAVIVSEERTLQKEFGQEYVQYRHKVRRWI